MRQHRPREEDRKRKREEGSIKLRGEHEEKLGGGGGGRGGCVALISWQFGIGPALPGNTTDVSGTIRHARREGTGTANPTHI